MRNTLGLKSKIYIEPEGQFCMGQNKQIAYNDLKVISRLILQCLNSPETIIHQQTNNNQKQNADSKQTHYEGYQAFQYHFPSRDVRFRTKCGRSFVHTKFIPWLSLHTQLWRITSLFLFSSHTSNSVKAPQDMKHGSAICTLHNLSICGSWQIKRYPWQPHGYCTGLFEWSIVCVCVCVCVCVEGWSMQVCH